MMFVLYVEPVIFWQSRQWQRAWRGQISDWFKEMDYWMSQAMAVHLPCPGYHPHTCTALFDLISSSTRGKTRLHRTLLAETSSGRHDGQIVRSESTLLGLDWLKRRLCDETP